MSILQVKVFHQFYLSLVIASVVSANACANNRLQNAADTELPVIEEIVITTHPIFDENNPDENNWLFRLVNRLHINTQKRTIKKELTFKEGDLIDQHLIDESARRLRSKRFIGDASVKMVNKKGGPDYDQQVQVDVKEVWTLLPKLTYSRSGGNTHYGYGLHDSNFLGLGKTLKLEHKSTEVRTSDEIVYRDPNIGKQNQLTLGYADNSDGKARLFNFTKPFASIRTSWSSGIDFQDFNRDDTLFNAGNEVIRFGHKSNAYSVFSGVRLPPSNDQRIHRLIFGYENTIDEFFHLPSIGPDTFNLPYARDYQTWWAEYQYINNRFIEALNIQQINRVEDINLGAEWHLRLGRVSADAHELDQTTRVQLTHSRAYSLSANQLLVGELSSAGFYGSSQTTQSISQFGISYHWQNFSKGQFYASFQAAYGKNLFVDTPMELGGDTGLRGYPARFQAGDKLRLFVVEQRFFGETEWLSLFHMGAAVFYDEGRVWGNSAITQTYQQALRSVGFGLRVSGTRTGGKDDNVHNVTHIDIAYPLDTGPEIDKYQFSVQIKSSF